MMSKARRAPRDLLVAADRLAKDVLAFAEIGSMPDEFWKTDRRIGRACRQLGWTRTQARAWARRTQR
jgi:hypothetical protein